MVNSKTRFYKFRGCTHMNHHAQLCIKSKKGRLLMVPDEHYDVMFALHKMTNGGNLVEVKFNTLKDQVHMVRQHTYVQKPFEIESFRRVA